MKELSYLDTPIEVLSLSPRLDMICARLRAAGFRPYKAETKQVSSSLDPLLVDLAAVDLDNLLLDPSPRRPIVLLGADDDSAPDGAIRLHDVEGFAGLARQLEHGRRRQLLEIEADLRVRTIATIAPRQTAPQTVDTPRVLFLGGGSAAFLALTAGLRAKGCECVAAFTQGTASEFVARQPIHAIVVESIGGTRATTNRWIDFIDREAALMDSAVYFSVDEEALIDEALVSTLGKTGTILEPDMPYQRAVEIIRIGARKIVQSAPATPTANGPAEVFDRSTGLFTRTFLELHLDGQIMAADESECPLSIMSIRLNGCSDSIMSIRLLSQLAQPLRAALRRIDLPVRYDSQTLIISMASTPYSGGVALAGRLRKVFEQSDETAPLVSDLSWRVVERRRYHSPDALLKSVTIGPFSRLTRAA